MADGLLATLMPESLAAVEKVSAQVRSRRIDLHDPFADFDRLRSKVITAAQFTRVLSLHQITLAPDELAALIRQFTQTSLPGPCGRRGGERRAVAEETGPNVSVRYHDFLEALRGCLRRGVESGAGKENEDETGKGAELGGRGPESCARLPAEERTRLQAALQRMREAVQSRGLHVVPVFQDMDPLRTGRVTASQFTRGVTMALQEQLVWHPGGGFAPSVLGLMLRAYGDGQGNVHYMAWCRDVDASLRGGRNVDGDENVIAPPGRERGEEGGSALFQGGPGVTNPALSAPELVQILRTQLALYRLRGEDYFSDYDPFKTGLVTAPQFESALGRLDFVRFALTRENVQTLIRAYAAAPPGPSGTLSHNPARCATETPYEQVAYTRFLYDINPKNFPHTRELSEKANPVNYFHETHAANRFLSTPHERAEADRILDKVRRQVSTNRIFLTPVLRDMDRVRKAIAEHRICTAARFARALATQNVILPQPELEVLVRKYTIPHADGTPSGDVHYYQFVLDVDPSQAGGEVTPRTPAEPQPQPHSPPPPPPAAPDLKAVLARISQQAAARQLPVEAFFPDFDPLRRGKLAPSHFITALGTAGVVLGPDELAVLLAAYETPTGVKAGVDVAAFRHDLRAVARARPDATTQPGVRGGPGEKVCPAAEADDALARLHSRLRHHVATYHALLTPFFADFDRHHRGKITRAQFLQALRRHGFVLSPDETALLCRCYACPEDGSRVAYRAFIAAVEAPPRHDDDDDDDDDQRTIRESCGGEAGEQAGTPAAALLGAVLQKICAFVRQRGPHLGEFFPDGDELRHGHVSRSRFRHAVNILGLTFLTEDELGALERHFARGPDPNAQGGDVDYPDFVRTIREMLAREGRGGAGVERGTRPIPPIEPGGAAETQLYTETLARIRRKLGARHTQSLAAFREYDRARKGYVKEGQFFGCLCALLGAPQTPVEASVLTKAFSMGNGEMAYTAFCAAVDDASFKDTS